MRACEKKQRQLGEAEMTERLGRLRDYEERLRLGQETQLEMYGEHATAVWVESAALLRPALSTRWAGRW